MAVATAEADVLHVELPVRRGLVRGEHRLGRARAAVGERARPEAVEIVRLRHRRAMVVKLGEREVEERH
jgi:hypothetical protein